MKEATIQKIEELQGKIEKLRAQDKEIAEYIVDDVLNDMISQYEWDFKEKLPEELSDTINVLVIYKRDFGSTIMQYGEDGRIFMRTGDGRFEGVHSTDTCARSFDLLEFAANNEGIEVRQLTPEELTATKVLDAVGGYKFSLKRRDLERVLAHPEALKENKTIPQTLLKIGKK